MKRADTVTAMLRVTAWYMGSSSTKRRNGQASIADSQQKFTTRSNYHAAAMYYGVPDMRARRSAGRFVRMIPARFAGCAFPARALSLV
jgi:hypothetical protein